MILLYLTFGTDPVVHQQATFSAMTFLAHSPAEVVVLTDAPDYYAPLAELARIKTITAAELAEWKGPHDYFWRIKIRALQQMVVEYPGRDLVYVDADTFCFADPAPLLRSLESGGHLMHAREGIPADLPTNTERRMSKETLGKTFGGLTVRPDHAMYNAGVVALSGERAAKATGLALDVCDGMCEAGVSSWLKEQFSVSLALQEAGGLTTANGCIGHYWGNKTDWNERISRYFLTHFLRGSSIEEQIAGTREIDFREIPVYRKSSSTQKKFHRWISEKIRTMPTASIPTPGTQANDLSERWRAER